MIILASASPRRQELIKLICNDFKVMPSDIDETVPADISAEYSPEYLAVQKAQHIYKKSSPDNVVIGCDTGVFIDNIMLGKPGNEKNAFEMLKMLSGKTHRVITGCAIIHEDKTISFSEVTKVNFYKLTDEEILEYVKTGEPLDKAGAYGIQGKGALLVKGINGDYFNVVGLPVARLKREFDKIINGVSK